MTPIDTAELERHADTERNRIINWCSADLESIVNGHDPEIHNLNVRVWDRLDRMAVEIEQHFARRKAEADLVSALRQTAAILLAEKNRSGGQPFSGIWSMPAFGIRATVDETLDKANELLGRYLPTTPEADGGSDAE
ncbi:hypothetical protein [Paracoccus sp. SSJ]|uniref:hypothetical protein n=1 Tax=Paracoccus sp. SSJ TaxID=3050636 RepID=UPI00254CE807|nr:hypothetical protein [Paracoccus sp. SSJ]MDK8874361.1 hypothetical protein [Paracoccus sp. SSJ]